MNIFDLFIRHLLEQWWMHPARIDESIVQDTTEIFIDRFVTVLTSKLSDDDQVIFLELIETNDTLNPAMEFIKMKLWNYNDILEDTMDEFSQEYLSEMSK